MLIGLLLVLIGYLSYLQIIDDRALVTNPYNRRIHADEALIHRGSIVDTKGVVLAETQSVNGVNRRVYPQGKSAAHLLGYSSEIYGKAGLESIYDTVLLGMEGSDRIRNSYYRLLGQNQRRGGDVVLTIDSSLQKLAEELLGSRRGAVVLMDCRTGALRVVASSPGYDPNTMDSNWSRISQAEDAPLLNRAFQGAYPPGSVYKLVTAAGVLAAKPNVAAETFDCAGSFTVDGYKLTDSGTHGQVDLKESLAVSCNTAFAQLGLSLGADRFYRTFSAFGMNQQPMADIGTRVCTMAAAGQMSQTELAASAIGQGELLVNPLHMALVTAAIANQGRIMRPYLIEYIKDSTGAVTRTTTSSRWVNATTPAIAEEVKAGMVQAVRSGTATGATVSGVQVAGKTGSAQNPHGESHAWFVGFAPADQPRLCIAVVVENAGAGGTVAAPLAGKLFTAAFAQGY